MVGVVTLCDVPCPRARKRKSCAVISGHGCEKFHTCTSAHIFYNNLPYTASPSMNSWLSPCDVCILIILLGVGVKAMECLGLL